VYSPDEGEGTEFLLKPLDIAEATYEESRKISFLRGSINISSCAIISIATEKKMLDRMKLNELRIHKGVSICHIRLSMFKAPYINL
jgi:hypothetical protein